MGRKLRRSQILPGYQFTDHDYKCWQSSFHVSQGFFCSNHVSRITPLPPWFQWKPMSSIFLQCCLFCFTRWFNFRVCGHIFKWKLISSISSGVVIMVLIFTLKFCLITWKLFQQRTEYFCIFLYCWDQITGTCFFLFFRVFAVETLKKIKIPWNLPNISRNSCQENNADVVENSRILDTYVCSCWYWNKRKLQCL